MFKNRISFTLLSFLLFVLLWSTIFMVHPVWSSSFESESSEIVIILLRKKFTLNQKSRLPIMILNFSGQDLWLKEINVKDVSGKSILKVHKNRELKDISKILDKDEFLYFIKKDRSILKGKFNSEKIKSHDYLRRNICFESLTLNPIDILFESNKKLVGSIETKYQDSSNEVLLKTIRIRIPIWNGLPSIQEWKPGDGHMHSIFSDGYLPIGDLALSAEEAGLKWGIITDHGQLLNEKKWFDISENINEINLLNDNFTMLQGEELSTYNPNNNQSIPYLNPPYDAHYLAYNLNDYIPNYLEDSLYYFDQTRQNIINAVKGLPVPWLSQNPNYDGYGFIAHPFSLYYPWYENNWPDSEIDPTGFSGIEIFNHGQKIADSRLIQKWVNLLDADLTKTLHNKDFISIIANSDSHYGLTLGDHVTYLHLPKLMDRNQETILSALEKGKAVASGDGSFVGFTLNGQNIGEVVNLENNKPIIINIKARAVNGHTLKEIRFISNYEKSKSYKYHAAGVDKVFSISPPTFKGSSKYPYPINSCYYRVESDFIDNYGRKATVYTNPIFVRIGSSTPIDTEPKGNCWRWIVDDSTKPVSAFTDIDASYAQSNQGDLIESSIWLNRDGAQGFINFELQAYDGNGNFISTFAGRTISNNEFYGWQKINISGLAPAGTASVKASIYAFQFQGIIDLDNFILQNYDLDHVSSGNMEENTYPLIFDQRFVPASNELVPCYSER